MNDKEIVIIVNAREKVVHNEKLSYEDMIHLAFDDYVESESISYTIIYSKGNSEKPTGSLTKGESVKAHKGMIVNVTRTDRS